MTLQANDDPNDAPHSHAAVDVQARQDPLCARYRDVPEEAMIRDYAHTADDGGLNAFHGRINFGRSTGGATVVNGQPVEPDDEEYSFEMPTGIHRAVGGDHDFPNPGNLLCAALATCLDSTIRMIANRLGVDLASLEVEVMAEADVRGTLVVDREVPVQFQSMSCRIDLEPVSDTNPRLLKKLITAAEYSCVNLQTLRSGVPVETHLTAGAAP